MEKKQFYSAPVAEVLELLFEERVLSSSPYGEQGHAGSNLGTGTTKDW